MADITYPLSSSMDDRDTDEVYDVFYPEEDGDFDNCPYCSGTGYVNPLTAPKDFFCTGTTDCPGCDGSGKI